MYIVDSQIKIKRDCGYKGGMDVHVSAFHHIFEMFQDFVVVTHTHTHTHTHTQTNYYNPPPTLGLIIYAEEITYNGTLTLNDVCFDMATSNSSLPILLRAINVLLSDELATNSRIRF